MRLLTLLIAVCCLTSACASGVKPTLAAPLKVPPPANLTAPPLPLPPPTSGQLRELETNHRETARTYHQLALQMCNLLLFLEIRHDECEPWTNSP